MEGVSPAEAACQEKDGAAPSQIQDLLRRPVTPETPASALKKVVLPGPGSDLSGWEPTQNRKKGASVLQPVKRWSEYPGEAGPQVGGCGYRNPSSGQLLVDLVVAARAGDSQAWEALVDRLAGVVWRATADTGLSYEDRQDVFAAAFFRLYEHLDDVREPMKLPGWMATTARNEVRQLLRAKRRLEPRHEVEPAETVQLTGVDEGLLDGELRTALRTAFLRLGAPCQELLRLTTAVPPLSYDEISQLTGIARGSLGPSRQRCLEHLRRTPELRPFLEGTRR